MSEATIMPLDEDASNERPVTLGEFYKFVQGTPDEEVWEFMRGHPVRRASTNMLHQRIAGEVFVAMYDYFKARKCDVFTQRDVQLFESFDKTGHMTSVLVPDILVLCDQSKGDGQTILGAPDLVVEIWAPGNSAKERQYKTEQYLSAGVREFWEIFPTNKQVCIRSISQGGTGYDCRIMLLSDEFRSVIFPELVIDLSEFNI